MVGRPRAGEHRAAEGHPAPALGESSRDDGKISSAAGAQAGCRSRRGSGGRGGKSGQGGRDDLPQPAGQSLLYRGGNGGRSGGGDAPRPRVRCRSRPSEGSGGPSGRPGGPFGGGEGPCRREAEGKGNGSHPRLRGAVDGLGGSQTLGKPAGWGGNGVPEVEHSYRRWEPNEIWRAEREQDGRGGGAQPGLPRGTDAPRPGCGDEQLEERLRRGDG